VFAAAAPVEAAELRHHSKTISPQLNCASSVLAAVPLGKAQQGGLTTAEHHSSSSQNRTRTIKAGHKQQQRSPARLRHVCQVLPLAAQQRDLQGRGWSGIREIDKEGGWGQRRGGLASSWHDGHIPSTHALPARKHTKTEAPTQLHKSCPP